MTVPSAVSRSDFIGSGATATFSFPFRIFAATDLLVVQKNTTTGVATTLVYGVDYTVPLASVNNALGGTITLTAGVLATGQSLSIINAPSATQPTSYVNQGGFFPQSEEDSFDRVTKVDLWQQDQLNRALMAPPADQGAAMTLPTKELRKGFLLGFDATTGNPVAVAGASASVSAAMTSVVGAPTTALARAAMGPWNDAVVTSATGTASRALAARFGDVLTPYDFGCVGDGTTDDATNFQAAITAAAGAGKVLYLAPGTYRLRSQMVLPSSLTMTGPGRVLLDPAAYLDKAMRALGSEGTAINLTVNAAAGAITVTMASTTGLTAGQMVVMRSDVLSGQNPQEALIIDSLTGTVVTFRTPLVNAYATANTARIVPITPKTNIVFDGVWFDCGATSDIGYLLSLEYVYGVRFEDCKFTNHRTVTSPTVQAAVLVNTGFNARVERCWGKTADAGASGSGNFASFVCGSQFSAIGNQSYGYSFGIGAFQASHVNIADNLLRGNRGAGNRGIKVAGCYGATIVGNVVTGFDTGIKDQDSRDVSITGNVIEQCCLDTSGSAINVSNANATTNEAATHAITGNIVRGTLGNGILVEVGSYHAVVSGNIIEDTQGRAIIANAQQVAITGNHIRDWGKAYVGSNDQNFAAIYVDRAASVIGNRGHNTLTTVPFIALTANATVSTIECVSDNVSPTNDILWIGSAIGGAINGTSIRATTANVCDPQRRWVGSVGGAVQSKSVLNNQTFTVTMFNDGMMFSVALGGGQAALFFACNSSATITLLSDVAAAFSVASGTAGRFNVFKSAGTGVISFENKTGGTAGVSVAFCGARVATITDPA